MEIDSGGAQYRKIKEALQRITFTGIVSKNALYSGKRKQWIEDNFHLYERIVFKGMEMPDGKTADTNYVYLNSWYLDNINSRYVKPVDWEYYRSLETPVSQRLYELLSVKFYGLLMKKGKCISYSYSTLCTLLPITRQRFPSDAKKVLVPAHEKLKQTGFLEDWSWEERTQKRDDKDWLIKYHPGERAKAEIKRFGVGKQLELELPPSSEQEATADKDELSTGEPDTVKQLAQRRITETAARKLVREHPIDQIHKQIEVFDWLKETKSQSVATNAPGFLRKSIEENYQPPDEYVKYRDRQTKHREAEDRKERWLQHREELIKQDLAEWDETPSEERVAGRVDAWKLQQKLESKTPTQEQIQDKLEELIDSLPRTDQEKREYLRNQYAEDPPADFA